MHRIINKTGRICAFLLAILGVWIWWSMRSDWLMSDVFIRIHVRQQLLNKGHVGDLNTFASTTVLFIYCRVGRWLPALCHSVWCFALEWGCEKFLYTKFMIHFAKCGTHCMWVQQNVSQKWIVLKLNKSDKKLCPEGIFVYTLHTFTVHDWFPFTTNS